jgi:hypothetical protein
MSQRVTVCGKVKALKGRSRSESESEYGDNESHAVDPKRDELHMARLKRP